MTRLIYFFSDNLFRVSFFVFFFFVAAMVAGQAVAVVTLNGDLAVSLSNLIAKPASTVSAVATVLAMILGYIRGQMSS